MDSAKRSRTSASSSSNGESSKRRKYDDDAKGVLYDNSKLSTFSVAEFADKGKKPHMEDRRVIFSDFSRVAASAEDRAPFRKHRFAMFAVYDGHGGSEASEYLQKHFHISLLDQLVSIKDFSEAGAEQSADHQDYIKNVLVKSFRKTDKELLDHLKLIVRQSGSTGVVCLLIGQTVWTANVGDSKAVLARLRPNGTIKGKSLSKDHNPILLDERQRIDKSGGHVKDGRVNGRLEVSRSFGDPSFKSFGVISTPYISRVELSDRDQFLIIGCDGLWSHFPVQDAVEFVRDMYNHYSKPDDATVCRKLVREAVMERGAPDNVTAVLVRLHHPWSPDAPSMVKKSNKVDDDE